MEIRFEMRRKRHELDMSCRELGELIGCSGDHVNNMELGNKRFMEHWVERINKVYANKLGRYQNVL